MRYAHCPSMSFTPYTTPAVTNCPMHQQIWMYEVRTTRRRTGATSDAYAVGMTLNAPHGTPDRNCPTKSTGSELEKKTTKIDAVIMTMKICSVHRYPRREAMYAAMRTPKKAPSAIRLPTSARS
jgi:hypothetical protein